MTYEEALKYAKGGLAVYQEQYPHLTTQIEWQKTIIQALEKQIPKRPEDLGYVQDADDTFFYLYHCKCGCNLHKWYDFCPICGSAIDWYEV